MQIAYAESQSHAELSGPDIAKRINAILAEKGIPKAVFYRACGISSGAFSQWRTGTTTPTLKNLARIAQFLDVPLADLMGGKASLAEAVRQDRKRRANIGYTPPMALKDRRVNAVIQDAKDRYGIMFDASKGATEDEMLATIAFLRTLREQRSGDED